MISSFEMFEDSIKKSSFFLGNMKPETLINEVKETLELLKEHKIPNKYSKQLFDNFVSIYIREEFIRLQGFTLLTHEWIDKLVKWIGTRKCIEVMAGSGSLSKILRDKNIDIIATDTFTWTSSFGSWNSINNYWTSIEKIDCVDAIEKYKDRDLVIMSWPPYQEDSAYKCLLQMRKVNPNMQMIVIGEGSGGCTADDAFLILLKKFMMKISITYQEYFLDGLEYMIIFA